MVVYQQQVERLRDRAVKNVFDFGSSDFDSPSLTGTRRTRMIRQIRMTLAPSRFRWLSWFEVRATRYCPVLGKTKMTDLNFSFPFQLQKPLSPFKKEPGDCGWIVVSVEEKAGLKDMILFELGATNLDKKDLFSESDPFFTISKVNSDDSETLVYRSEFIKDDPNPQWSLVEISKEKLCNGDNKRKLKVEVLDYDENGKHDLIGNFTTTLEEVIDASDP